VTFTNTKGASVSVTGGFMMLDGPMGSVTIEGHEDFSRAVADSTGYSDTKTDSTSTSIRLTVAGGAVYNRKTRPFLLTSKSTLKCHRQHLSPPKIGARCIHFHATMAERRLISRNASLGLTMRIT
jgi:hypothetical protein